MINVTTSFSFFIKESTDKINLTQDVVWEYLESGDPKKVSIAVQRVQWVMSYIMQEEGENRWWIGDDNLIYCNGDIRMIVPHAHQGTHKRELPLKFGKIEGQFNCSFYGLETLKGSPHEVNRFICANNKLESLEGAPEICHELFNCSNNYLTDLRGGPKKVGKSYYCRYNSLTSLEGIPNSLSDLDCSWNKLKDLKGAPSNLDILEADNNSLTTLEGGPQMIDYLTVFGNKLNHLKGAPRSCNWFLFKPQKNGYSIKLPRVMKNLIEKSTKINALKAQNRQISREGERIVNTVEQFFATQEDFGIWDSQGSFVEKNYNLLAKWLGI